MDAEHKSLDADVLRAIAKWPDVPDCFGWLALDQRGQWRIQGETITHQRAQAFINRNYRRDQLGRWSFQNGPQRVFVDLDYTPWVYRLEADDKLSTHTSRPADALRAMLVDELGTLLLEAAPGVGVLHDADLQAAIANIVMSDGSSASDESIESELERLRKTGESTLRFRWGMELLPIKGVNSADLPVEFGFIQRPR